ncbi:MAG TPA: GTP-binding protein [Steroidobacteraceae bacterium]|jgi:G3E family GTPase|nr:GTP-binding protein [Steroidobacteraceae bacterium]
MTRAHVITGSFGSGKTTAIRRLMAQKPENELWIVILNEFTDAGIDALNVAQSARGNYDVRLVAGGCLCCVGELEFGKQLRDILRNFKPSRLLIEPSGAGHAADIVDTLSLYETQRALELDSVICLVDSQDASRILAKRPSSEWSQIQSADALLMSKPDLADEEQRKDFEEIAAEQYPAKAYLGTCSQGNLPEETLRKFERSPRFSLVSKYEGQSMPQSLAFDIAGIRATEMQLQALGFWAVQWILPRELTFSRAVLEPRLNWLLETSHGWVRRVKGVFRTGLGPSWLIQASSGSLSGEDSAFRRDSRIEVVLSAAPTPEFLESWRGVLRDAANPPR